MKLIFDWDLVKAKVNVKNHKIDFDEAKEIFSDTLAITFRDDAHSIDEERFITIGTSRKNRLLLVVHTENETIRNNVIIRIISCRKATKAERMRYEKDK